jgi:hypothetical protein
VVALLLTVSLRFSKMTVLPLSIALAMLTFPFTQLAALALSRTVLFSILVACIVIGAAIFILARESSAPRRAATLAVLGIAVLLGSFGALRAMRGQSVPMPVMISAPAVDPATSGAIAWARGIALIDALGPPAESRSARWTAWYVKLPAWLGLVLLIGSAFVELALDGSVLVARGKRDASAPTISG